jgi:hypothetical protein
MQRPPRTDFNRETLLAFITFERKKRKLAVSALESEAGVPKGTI